MEFIKNYPIDKLIEWEKNPRKNDDASEKLAKIIEKYGFINPIIIDQNNIIRAGHTRLKSAQKLGLKEVPVIKVNFNSEEEAIGYSIADNKSQEWAVWDDDKLSEVLNDLKEKDFDLEFTGFSKEALDLLNVSYDEIELENVDFEGEHLERNPVVIIRFDNIEDAKFFKELFDIPIFKKSAEGKPIIEKIKTLIKNENSNTDI